jgi:hypothetical protein
MNGGWVIAPIAFAVYLLSYAPVYWAADKLGLIADGPGGMALALGLVYAPIWILSQVSPFDSVIFWYWELWMPPFER